LWKQKSVHGNSNAKYSISLVLIDAIYTVKFGGIHSQAATKSYGQEHPVLQRDMKSISQNKMSFKK